MIVYFSGKVFFFSTSWLFLEDVSTSFVSFLQTEMLIMSSTDYNY